MAISIIYAQSGGGKTVNSTRVEGTSYLIDSDNSSIVLQNFARPNTKTYKIRDIADFVQEFERAATEKVAETIIVDNMTDILDRWLLELGERGKNGGNPGIQDYQTVYNAIKRIVRKAALAEVNVIFNFWQDTHVVTQPDGSQISMINPKIPQKILENICGLCNIVAHIEVFQTKDEKQWFYRLEGTNNLYAKDQLFCRKTCLPEDVFNGKGKK